MDTNLDLGMNDCTVVVLPSKRKMNAWPMIAIAALLRFMVRLLTEWIEQSSLAPLDELKKRNHVEQDIQLTDDALKEAL